jgi:hypothetical protein
MMWRAMPSPNGTNKARLYIPAGFFSHPMPTHGACDSPCGCGEMCPVFDKFDQTFDSKGANRMSKYMSEAAIRRAVRRAMYAQGATYGMAYDQAGAVGFPVDDETSEEVETQTIKSICDYVSENFSREGIQSLVEALSELDDGSLAGDVENMDPRGLKGAQDSFNRRYPDATRIGHAPPYGQQPPAPRRTSAEAMAFDKKSGKAAQDFFSRYPDCKRIGHQ